MTLKPTPNQMVTTMITGTPDGRAIALVAKLRLNCCKRLLAKMDETSPEGVVFATIVMEAKTILQAAVGLHNKPGIRARKFCGG